MDLKSFKKGLIISIIIGILVFAGLSMYADFDKLLLAFSIFDYHYLPLILILAPLNYFFRYIKWSYYLSLIDAKVPKKDNILIFLSGLCMTITPGKVGEFLKSYLLKEKENIPLSSTAPLIVGERLTDGISVLILAGIGAFSYNQGVHLLLFILIGVIGFIWIVQSPKLVYKILDLFNKIKFLKRFENPIKNFYEKSYLILKWKPLIFAISIGVISWFFEGVVFYFSLKALNFPISLLACVFVVSFSFIIGALSMMPGGLFAVEGSVVGLLAFMNVPKDLAAAATIISRFSTLWLGVVIGLIGFILICKNSDDH